MDILSLALLIGVVLACTEYLRKALTRPTIPVLLFLYLESEERDNDGLPVRRMKLRKFVSYYAAPLPGVEIDDQGARPLKVARTVFGDGQVVVDLHPLAVSLDTIQPYAEALVKDMGWEVL